MGFLCLRLCGVFGSVRVPASCVRQYVRRPVRLRTPGLLAAQHAAKLCNSAEQSRVMRLAVAHVRSKLQDCICLAGMHLPGAFTPAEPYCACVHTCFVLLAVQAGRGVCQSAAGRGRCRAPPAAGAAACVCVECRLQPAGRQRAQQRGQQAEQREHSGRRPQPCANRRHVCNTAKSRGGAVSVLLTFFLFIVLGTGLRQKRLLLLSRSSTTQAGLHHTRTWHCTASYCCERCAADVAGRLRSGWMLCGTWFSDMHSIAATDRC